MGEPERSRTKRTHRTRVPMRRSLPTSREILQMCQIADLPARGTKTRTDGPVGLGSQTNVSGACTYALNVANNSKMASEHIRTSKNPLTHLIEVQKRAERSYRGSGNGSGTSGTHTCVGMKSRSAGKVEDPGNVADAPTVRTDAQSVQDDMKTDKRELYAMCRSIILDLLRRCGASTVRY